MPHHIRLRRILDLTLPASRCLITASLLASAACSGVDADQTTLDPQPKDEPADEQALDSPPSQPGSVGALAQPLLGSDACKNADVRIVNNGPDPITVTRLEFYNQSDGTWRTEELTNRVVSPGAMEFWTPDFQYAKGDVISSFNVCYDHLDHSHGRYLDTPNQTCVTGAVYLLEID